MSEEFDPRPSVDLVVAWASQRPPMPRDEFKTRVATLFRGVYRQAGGIRRVKNARFTQAQRDELYRRMETSPTTPTGRRKRRDVKRMCEEFDVSRQYLYKIYREEIEQRERA